MKKLLKFSMIALAAAIMLPVGCKKATEPEVQVSGVSLNKTTLALTVGASETLTATVTPAEAKNRAVSWKSSDESVATVTNGAVSAKKAGNATITVTTTENNRTATCAITVSDPPMPEAKIKLADPSHATQTAWADELHTGAGFTFTALAAWTAEVKAATATRASGVEWVRLLSGGTEKYDGAAGTHTLTVGLDNNYTGAARSATVTLTAGGEKVEVNITHAGTKEDGSAHTPPTTFIAVTGITGVPTAATAGTPLTLTGIVAPDNATNSAITWTVKSAGTTGATISGATFNATAAGTATITATVKNGATATTDYTKDFSITVSAAGSPLTFTDSDTYSIPPSTVGMAITPIDVSGAVSGGKTPYTFSATGLPTGITINASTGIISGIAATAKTGSTATIRVEDSSSPKQSQTITIAIGAFTAPPSAYIAISAVTSGKGLQAGVAITPTYAPDGSWARYAFSSNLAEGDYPVSGITVSGLPAGVTLGGGSGIVGKVQIDASGFGSLDFHGDGSQAAVTDKVVTVTIGGATGTFKMTIAPAAAPTKTISALTQTQNMVAGATTTPGNQAKFTFTTTGIDYKDEYVSNVYVPNLSSVSGLEPNVHIAISGGNGTLTVQGKGTQTAGTYSGLTLNIDGVTSPAFTLKIDPAAASDTTKPTVKSVSPSGTGAPTSGNVVVTFSEPMDTTPGVGRVSAGSTQLSGGTWSVGNTVFTIPYSGLFNDYTYHVGISGFKDVAGNTMSANSSTSFTTVTAASPLAVTNPSNVTVAAGGTATMSVTASGGTTPYKYQWQGSVNGTSGWGNVGGGNVSGQTTEELTVKGAATATTGTTYYRCVVTDSKDASVESDPATLTVVAVGTKTVTVGEQDYPMVTGVGNPVIGFPFTTTGIVNGQYTATLSPTVTGVAVYEEVTVYNNVGRLKLYAPGTSHQAGKYSITLTIDNTTSKPFTLTITPPPVAVTGVSLNKTSTSMAAGSTEPLFATVLPEDATNQKVTWKSSNETVATVSGGTVSAKKAGTATITVTTDDGAKTATCTVTVVAAGTKTVTVGEQNYPMTTGAGSPVVSFPFTTTGIANGVYTATLSPTVAGVAVYGETTVYNNAGWLQLYAPGMSHKAGEYNISLTIDNTTSAPFKLTINELHPDPTAIEFKRSTIGTWYGKQTTIEYTLTPENADPSKIKWTVNNKYSSSITTTLGTATNKSINIEAVTKTAPNAANTAEITLVAEMPNGTSRSVDIDTRLDVTIYRVGNNSTIVYPTAFGETFTYRLSQTGEVYFQARGYAEDGSLINIPASAYTLTSSDTSALTVAQGTPYNYRLTRTSANVTKEVTLTFKLGNQTFTGKVALTND